MKERKVTDEKLRHVHRHMGLTQRITLAVNQLAAKENRKKRLYVAVIGTCLLLAISSGVYNYTLSQQRNRLQQFVDEVDKALSQEGQSAEEMLQKLREIREKLRK